MPIRFSLPANLTTFDYSKIVKESEILPHDYFPKPKTYLQLLHTKTDATKIYVPVITAGNMSAIQGKAKARKTFFMVLASSLIVEQNDINIAVFDTEQYKWHSLSTLHRINALAPKNKLSFFNLRKYSIEVRIEFVESYILKEKPELIFLDNIRDCMIDINSWVETNNILTTFIQLADDVGTHICVALHENPGKDNDKARGAIGTELQNKCETIFRVEKDANSPENSNVKGLFTRNMEFDTFSFMISEQGLPILTATDKASITDDEDAPF